MSDTPTPRTDALKSVPMTRIDSDNFARQLERELAAANAALAKAKMPDSLHPETKSLVRRFASALAEKLAAAEKKYGYSDGWQDDDWMHTCRQKLAEHLEKGDPRDVAAYCAFLWHHGESTAPVMAIELLRERNSALEKERDDAIRERTACHEIYDEIRRAFGYPDGVGYPMLQAEAKRIVADLATRTQTEAGLREQVRVLIEALKNADEGISSGQDVRSQGDFTRWMSDVQKLRPKFALFALTPEALAGELSELREIKRIEYENRGAIQAHINNADLPPDFHLSDNQVEAIGSIVDRLNELEARKAGAK